MWQAPSAGGYQQIPPGQIPHQRAPHEQDGLPLFGAPQLTAGWQPLIASAGEPAVAGPLLAGDEQPLADQADAVVVAVDRGPRAGARTRATSVALAAATVANFLLCLAIHELTASSVLCTVLLLVVASVIYRRSATGY